MVLSLLLTRKETINTRSPTQLIFPQISQYPTTYRTYMILSEEFFPLAVLSVFWYFIPIVNPLGGF